MTPRDYSGDAQGMFWEAFWTVFHDMLENGPMPAAVQVVGLHDHKVRCNPATAFRFAADCYGLTMEQFLSSDRREVPVEARKLAVWALKTLGDGWSYVAIGRALGGRDHTTIRNLHIKAKMLIRRSPRFAGACQDIQQFFAAHEEANHGIS